MNIIDNDLLSIQESRILIENAREAQKSLSTFPQEKLDAIVENIAKEMKDSLNELAIMSQDETDYGRWEDKYIKNKFVCEYLPNELRNMKCVGIISEDKVSKTMEVGVPLGVIVALCPATSPVSTTIYKSLISIKSGNAIVFSPHPRAKITIGKTIDKIVGIAERYGLPAGCISYLHTVTPSGTIELMNHKDTSLIINTGVPAMLKASYKSGKTVIYGGNGNGPAFIERTANIKQAVKDIIDSKTFDNGLVSAAEQSVVVDSCIATKVKQEMQNNGAYFMTEEESKLVGNLLFEANGDLNSEMVGKSAIHLAKVAGISVPNDTVLLVSYQKYVSIDNPYSKEKIAPIIAFYIEDDWMNACEKCIELLLSEKNGHTLVIHSNDEDVIKQFILKKPVGRVLVNTPASFGSMGMTTNLFPALTLGSASAGKGMTSDNVSPMNLIYIRKVGYGVRSVEEVTNKLSNPRDIKSHYINDESENHKDNVKLLQNILEKILKDLNK